MKKADLNVTYLLPLLGSIIMSGSGGSKDDLLLPLRNSGGGEEVDAGGDSGGVFCGDVEDLGDSGSDGGVF